MVVFVVVSVISLLRVIMRVVVVAGQKYGLELHCGKLQLISEDG